MGSSGARRAVSGAECIPEKTLLTDRALVGTVHCRCSTHGLCLAPGGTEPSLATKDASLRAVRASNAPDNLNLCGDGRGAKRHRRTAAALGTIPMASHVHLHIWHTPGHVWSVLAKPRLAPTTSCVPTLSARWHLLGNVGDGGDLQAMLMKAVGRDRGRHG